jgi:hypothetical protein
MRPEDRSPALWRDMSSARISKSVRSNYLISCNEEELPRPAARANEMWPIIKRAIGRT